MEIDRTNLKCCGNLEIAWQIDRTILMEEVLVGGFLSVASVPAPLSGEMKHRRVGPVPV